MIRSQRLATILQFATWILYFLCGLACSFANCFAFSLSSPLRICLLTTPVNIPEY
nr:MAG TPA: hypothetical protein [Caudoviricetes sp.]